MNRYMYYLIFINTVTNMIANVPRILLLERLNGAIPSIFLAIGAGVFITYIILKFFNKYPGKALPELLDRATPKWFNKLFLAYISVIWFSAGLITLTTCSFMIKRYLTPDMPLMLIILYFLLFFTYGIFMRTKNILYAIEIILVVTVPFVLFIIYKAFSSPYYQIDFVKEAIMYMNVFPSYDAFTASLYLFLGIANLIIFNRVFTKKITVNWKHLLSIGGIVGSALIITYIVPIGINGFEHVDQIIYPTVTAADSLKMTFGIVDRVVFLFVTILLIMAFLSTLIHWHVAINVVTNVIYIKKFKWKNINLTPHLFIGLFWLASFYMIPYLSEYQLLKFTNIFLNSLPLFFILLFSVFWIITRRVN
ncbi:GerAB/ArcD/ProY family transporter [Bacillus kwashiorkori]|uniref:GerAB/ArcD/ProY family transporter n=1 Tax=Bacillus kwashiorkori TaxID=1522318 RepID=UPI000785202F|nr:GerAB/ArcD/ProY family transporter [Bacillus kwashiorkori]